MPERIKLALIGCGGMGRRHLRGITRLSQSSLANLELVAVCDLNDENANYLADDSTVPMLDLGRERVTRRSARPCRAARCCVERERG